MDIVVYTSDPDAIDTDEIQKALEAIGYFVASVTFADRP
jgi:hypothetical protein